MDTVFVKPREGGRIRQPERGGRVMPDTGDRVLRDGYYERLIITGDVVVTEPPAADSKITAKLSPYPQPEPAPSAAAPSTKD